MPTTIAEKLNTIKQNQQAIYNKAYNEALNNAVPLIIDFPQERIVKIYNGKDTELKLGDLITDLENELIRVDFDGIYWRNPSNDLIYQLQDIQNALKASPSSIVTASSNNYFYWVIQVN